MVEVPNRKGERLRELAYTWIDKKFTVHSDEWRAYNFALEEYDHYKVCHKNIFVDLNMGGHVQQIEAS